ncbi:DUF1631 family protein [Variovorax sp. PCZ-1]|uniref:DUF1631 family protein n=1 Tax=Variovorax sp. PCZ-1 TaxID=2835533 RepID=UPI001BD0BEC9|nr:DUF1631 family protein [Variovorax sp. PCZ-1]MBS7806362.1 DUF1631 family protein [Variovorax sp. PCZ-1]
MDTPFPNISTEEFDALVAQQNQAPAQTGSAGMQTSGVLGPSDNLRQAMAWSLELAPQVMTNMVSRALQSLDRKLVSLAGAAPAQMLEQAAVAMEEQRMGWAKQYTPLLRMAMAYPAPAKMAAILAQVDLRICAQEAAQLDALVQAQGSRRSNPLSAQAYVQALLELINRSPASPELRKIWADHLLPALSSQLAWVYLQLQAVLRDPASRETSAISQTDGFNEQAAIAFGFAETKDDSPAGHEDAGLDTQTQQLAEQARRTVLRLQKHLGMSAEDGDALAQALSGNPMDALLHDLDLSEQLMAKIRERGLPMPSMDESLDHLHAATQLNTLTVPVEEKAPVPEVSEEKIAELLKSYRNTTSPSLQRVPVPLQEALEDLKLPLLSLAHQEPALLTDDQHPAQKFLGLVTQRSLRYSSEMAEGFVAFMTPVDKLITAISVMPQPSSRVFEQAGTSLSTVWQRQDDAVALEESRKALEQAQMQEAKQLAGRLGFQLVGRKDAGDAPPMIKQFLMGPWAQVLARAQLFPLQAGDTERYTQVLAALLWSVSVRRAAPRKNEHATLIAKLIPQLKAGLQSINMPDLQADPLLSDIKKLQEAVQASVVAPDADTSISDPAPLLA